jgi:hypothetical protein
VHVAQHVSGLFVIFGFCDTTGTGTDKGERAAARVCVYVARCVGDARALGIVGMGREGKGEMTLMEDMSELDACSIADA